MSDTLYHYCDIHVFKSIIDKQSIWLTDITKSNDIMEKKWLTKGYKDFLARIAQTISNDEMKAILKSEVEKVESISDIGKSYVFCMSEKGDDLSQWRGYGDDGRGLAIGFDKNYFDFLLTAGAAFNTLSLKMVYYDVADPSEFLRFCTGLSIMETTSPEEALQGLQMIRNFYMTQTLYYKHPSFREEAEWRLCVPVVTGLCEYLLLGRDDSDFSKHFNAKFLPLEKHYYEKCDDLVSYLELKFRNMRSAIKTIYIGPKCKVSEEDIRMFLADSNFRQSAEEQQISIVYSQSTYR